MMAKLDHITINVLDEEASIRFYEDVMGFPFLERIDMGDHALAYMQMPGDVKLELITYDRNKSDQAMTRRDGTEPGIYRHLAFETDDLQGLCERLRSGGMTVLMPPCYIEKLESFRMLATDPNGVELEWIQYEKQQVSKTLQ